VLQGTASAETVKASDTVITLAMSAEELRTLLADNSDLVSGLFATLAELIPSPEVPVHPTGAAADLEQLGVGGLTAVDKVLALQRVALFSRVSAEEMRYLSEIARTVTMAAGETLFPESAPPALWVILSGELSLETSGGAAPVFARGGDVIGSTDTLAGKSLGRSASVTRPGVALRLDHDELLELLGERPELLRQMFAGIFRMRELVQPAAV
jgi:CRP-like cAMP-binding protein